MFVDFDLVDAAPIGKAQAYANRNAVDGPVWADLTYHSDPKDLAKRKTYYVSALGVAGAVHSLEENLADCGVLNIFTSGDSVANVSELFVDYEVELMTPAPSGSLLQQLVYLTTGVASNTPFASTSAEFSAGTESGSSPIIGWQDGATIVFLQKFVGQLILNYVGTGITTDIPDVGGTNTNITCGIEVQQTSSTETLQVFDVIADVGQIFTAIGLVATTITSMYARLYSSKLNLA
jgi:hypothetical protein